MLDAIKSLVDGGIINEDTSRAINEAWETRLSEAKETVRAELREEFAQRYEHDKSVMVEALDKMVTESITSELSEFAADKKALTEDRVKFKRFMRESSGKFNDFMVTKLAEEIKELRNDRKMQTEGFEMLEKFLVKALAEEIKEFAIDKKAVVETKVKLVAEAKRKLAEMKKTFIDRSSKLVQESVTKNLESELSQLKEDIQIARENMFGRRLFEAFASEFSVTHLNENKDIAKLQSLVKAKDKQLAEAKAVAAKGVQLAESKDREIRIIKESAQRKETMAELLKPLNREKASVMQSLLENVQTGKLRVAYDKYLPAVLNGSSVNVTAPRAAMLNESRKEVTGDKSAKPSVDTDINVIALKKLAGLN
jgi:hypothetical protein